MDTKKREGGFHGDHTGTGSLVATEIIPLSFSAGASGADTGAGERAAWRFLEFFTVNIRNKNTRAAYGAGGGRVPALVRGQGHHAHRGRAAGACGGLYRGAAGMRTSARPSSSISPASACCLTGW